ncbi:sensor histidine kinase [Streptococcus sp.]|uniref:sensor histidine kinase n=1 Tax=Streptococcus sp. TaxID=1306 RepID=UPI0035A13593
MIWKFFQEYKIWYSMYALMSALYFLSFYLYHLPLGYFVVSLLFNLTLLLIVTIWLFIQFRKKLLLIQNFFFVQDLDDLSLPSELAYQQLIEQLLAAESEKGLVEKSRMESLQTMVKMWSHQMKVPLSALSLMAQTDQLDRQEVRQQLLRLENYLDTLLTYLKFSGNKDDFRFEVCSVRELVVDLVKKYRVSCLAKELSVEVSGDWQLKSDKKWLSFAISQILDNAIKYSKRGGHIQVQLDEDGIQIADTGMGILPEDLPRLFEEGFTGYNGHEHKKATGLGLYMTKQVLDKLDLAIRVHSQVEEGTQVFIYKEKS